MRASAELYVSFLFRFRHTLNVGPMSKLKTLKVFYIYIYIYIYKVLRIIIVIIIITTSLTESQIYLDDNIFRCEMTESGEGFIHV